MYLNQCIIVIALLICCFVSEATSLFNNALDSPYPYSNALQSPFRPALSLSNNLGLRQTAPFSPFGQFSSGGASSNNFLKRRCPLCDSSVYGYCSEKLFHDSCCCHDPDNPYDQLPYQCQFADCSFLHANSCREHKLITACCCTNYLLYRK